MRHAQCVLAGAAAAVLLAWLLQPAVFFTGSFGSHQLIFACCSPRVHLCMECRCHFLQERSCPHLQLAGGNFCSTRK